MAKELTGRGNYAVFGEQGDDRMGSKAWKYIKRALRVALSVVALLMAAVFLYFLVQANIATRERTVQVQEVIERFYEMKDELQEHVDLLREVLGEEEIRVSSKETYGEEVESVFSRLRGTGVRFRSYDKWGVTFEVTGIRSGDLAYYYYRLSERASNGVFDLGDGWVLEYSCRGLGELRLP